MLAAPGVNPPVVVEAQLGMSPQIEKDSCRVNFAHSIERMQNTPIGDSTAQASGLARHESHKHRHLEPSDRLRINSVRDLSSTDRIVASLD